MSKVTNLVTRRSVPPPKIIHVMDSLDIGDQLVTCRCFSVAFGIKQKGRQGPYTAVCLGCGEETTIGEEKQTQIKGDDQ